MRSIEEIQHRLEETELELENVKDWATKVYTKYRKLWGKADYGEVDAAHKMFSKLTTEVNILKWVLHNNE